MIYKHCGNYYHFRQTSFFYIIKPLAEICLSFIYESTPEKAFNFFFYSPFLTSFTVESVFNGSWYYKGHF